MDQPYATPDGAPVWHEDEAETERYPAWVSEEYNDARRGLPYEKLWRIVVTDWGPHTGSAELGVLWALLKFSDSEGTSMFPSLETIADQIRTSESRVKHVLDKYEESGWLRVTRRRGSSNYYELAMPAERPGNNPRGPSVCGAPREPHKRGGDRGYCKRTAGWGTEHVGSGRCRDHDGR